MEWHQRSLTSMSVAGTSVSYTYNADGIRTQKTVGAGGHMYVLDGNTILKETIYTAGTLVNTLYYYYDESGVSGLEYNGTKYSYVKNLQGDVIGIINANGVTVVEYTYDAWGNILSVTGSMASTLGAINPFRYRGYYYDIESGWYYLNSRYYDPQVGRFLNADGIIGANGGILGYNMFAYCNDNPVMYVDPSGYLTFVGLLTCALFVLPILSTVIDFYNIFAEDNIDTTAIDKTNDTLGEIGEKLDIDVEVDLDTEKDFAGYAEFAVDFARALECSPPEVNVKRAILLNMLMWNKDNNTPIIDFGLADYSIYVTAFRADAALLVCNQVLSKTTYTVDDLDALVDNWEYNALYISNNIRVTSFFEASDVAINFIRAQLDDKLGILGPSGFLGS